MTNWLKWRLCALLGTAFLAGGATYLHAQSDYPPPAKTPEEAATQFFQLLDLFTRDDRRLSIVNDDLSLTPSARSVEYGIISRVEMKQFHQPTSALALVAQSINTPQFDARVTSNNGDQTLVEVTPSSTPKAHEVVVISEDGGYRVDLKATYGRWEGLSGDRLDDIWYRATGEASPAMRTSDTFQRSQCQTYLKQQMLGMLQYAQDYDERLPPARKWIDAVYPYVKSEEIFKCPSLTNPGNGYAYNQYLSQYSQASINSVATTISIYETSNLKRNVFGPGTGRAYRHADGWNLAFNDGHVKWFKRDNPTPLPFQFKP